MNQPQRLHAAAVTRRGFAASLAASFGTSAADAPRPNILWLTCEDTGPHLGCYGDRYGETPNLDGLASRGLRYLHAWSNAPVCAPARTTIISGMYPTSTGSEHMRSITRLPAATRMFPCYLRDAGYHCTNNSKEDYNLEHTGKVWDESSNKAHWRSRQPGQPFFSVFNFVITHESQIRTRPHQWKHDPAQVRVPAYHPDTPEVRHDWAQYYDNITTMDEQAGRVLRQLEEDGLAEDTIVFFYGDHGSGMPRSKRWPYNSGLQVPLIVHIPEKFRRLCPPDYRPGGTSTRLVSFVDLAPTVLSLAGLPAPAHLQGRAFLGLRQAPAPSFLHGFRGRMDERYDLVRTVSDGRYVYVRNYMPHRIYGQHIAYMFETPTTRVWQRLYREGKLNQVQSAFWRTKPPEELYDLQNDSDEVRNLATSADYRAILARLRQAQQAHAAEIRDVGLLPETEMHARTGSGAPYDFAADGERYPIRRVLAAATAASSSESGKSTPALHGLQDKEAGVRYWTAAGLLISGAAAVRSGHDVLVAALQDRSPCVRIAAAEALGRYGDDSDLQRSLPVLLGFASVERHGVHTSLLALNSIDGLGARAHGGLTPLRSISADDRGAPQRFQGYVPRLLEYLVQQLSSIPG